MATTDSPPGPPVDAPPAKARRRRLDRRTLAICVCIAAVGAMAAGLVASFTISDDPPAPASDLALSTAGDIDGSAALTTALLRFDGRPTSLGEYAGKGTPLVVNFFSSTCAPCIVEMPAFEQVHRTEPGVRFLGIDVQDEVGAGRSLIERTGITYEALRDPPGDLLRAVEGVGLPTTVLIDGEGRIVDSHTGALTEPALRDLIRRELG